METRSEHSKIMAARRAYARLLDESYGVRETSWRDRRDAVSALAPLAEEFLQAAHGLPGEITEGIVKRGIKRTGVRAGLRTVWEISKAKRRISKK